MTAPLHVLALTRYGSLGASSRMRMMQYFAALHRDGCDVEVRSLLDDQYLRDLYAGRRNLRAIISGYARRLLDCISSSFQKADCLLIEKELWPWAPAWLEKLLLRRKAWVLDLDDAIFHNYDQHRLPLVRKLYGDKIDQLMRAATIVTAGSPYLAQRALQAGARDVRVIPTAVDLAKYPSANSMERSCEDRLQSEEQIVIGWIGSPSTVHYLNVVMPALQQLAEQINLTLRVIGAKAPAIAGVRTESVPWTAATEVEQIYRFDIGIMPLMDSPWERGKCGYKLIQYMACGLPVVASPIGVNTDLVTPGVCGLLATSTQEWVSALLSIARDKDMAREFGVAGRRRVEAGYCTAVTSKAVLISLRDAAVSHIDVTPKTSEQDINDKR